MVQSGRLCDLWTPLSLPWPLPISWMLHVIVHNFVAFTATMKMLIMFTLPPLLTQSLCRSQLCKTALVCRGRNVMKCSGQRGILPYGVIVLFVSLPHLSVIQKLSTQENGSRSVFIPLPNLSLGFMRLKKPDKVNFGSLKYKYTD